MEISKALQEEILSVQNKLKNAIRDHQVCVVKLKDDPNNTDILDRIREIQLHIVSLGRWQKQVVQRLRKEVESLKVENSLNGTKISVAALLGLNNNNHITNNNEATRKVVDAAEHGKSLNGHVETQAKEDYEEIVRNGDVASPLQDGVSVKERRSTSVEPASGDDEVVEVPTGTSSPVDSIVLETEIEEKPKLAREQQCFLGCLGLITTARLIELQHKRAERKRRSTANSHFVYSNWEVPMKRKRHAYLQSLGDAPQTRQTTARLNGPSPPPTKSRSCSSAGRAATKSLIQATKTAGTAKPNILRNGDGKQKEVFVKSVKQEDKLQAKLVPTTSTGKTVHIPGLPSCLTIERIENDSTVCITCRNPGTLTVCESCSSKFHVSCHTITPASSYYCPKCMARFRSTGLTSAHLEILRRDVENIKKEKDTVAATYASRAFGKAGEDSEIHKTSSGLYKADATQTRQHLTAAALGINQLPSSTFLIPIVATDDDVSITAIDKSIGVPTTASTLGSTSGSTTSRVNCGVAEQQSSILLGQLSQSSLTESKLLLQAGVAKSNLVIEKVPGQSIGQRRWSNERVKPKQAISVLDYERSRRSKDEEQPPSASNAKPSGMSFVTVEVICHEDERASESSTDCVDVSEGSTGVPDVIDLESSRASSRADEAKHRDSEGRNVSSGSSIQPIDSPQPPEISNVSNGSSTNDFMCSFFPGRYGYKVDIVELEDDSNSVSCSPVERLVKLEETHLPTSPRAELIEEVDTSSQNLTTVPDNKSDETEVPELIRNPNAD